MTAAIGVVRDHLGEPGDAIRELREAARVLGDEEATHYEAQALVQLADIAERMGGQESLVRDCLNRALEIHEAAGSRLAEDLRRRLDDLDR
ncbi:hypothetical protein GCM10020295_37990 [Streptomyces cinereospinus]